MGRTLLRAQKTNFKPKDNGSSLGNGMAASGAGDWGVDKAKEKERVKMVSVLEVDNLEVRTRMGTRQRGRAIGALEC